MNEEESKNNKYIPKYKTSNDNYMSKIKNMFIKIIEKNKNNNLIKSSLINLPNFDPNLLFQEIDENNKGYISSLDLLNYLNKNSNKYNEQIIRRLIQQYDKHSHFRLIFDDFKAIIIPNNEIKEENNNPIKLNADKSELFNKIMKNESELIILINEIILDIKKCSNFITYEAFLSISNNSKNIDENEMKEFLGEKYDNDDIHSLIYYLDLNNDGLISYDEFEDFFTTLEIEQNEVYNIINKNEINFTQRNDEINNNNLCDKINDIKIKKTENEKNKIDNNYDSQSLLENRIGNKHNIIKEIKKQYIENDIEKKNYDINKINYETKNINLNIEKEFNDNKYKNKEENNCVCKNYEKNKIIDYDEYIKNKYNSNNEEIDSNKNNNNYLYEKSINIDKINNLKNEKYIEDNSITFLEKKQDKYSSFIKKNLKNYEEYEELILKKNKNIAQNNNKSSINKEYYNNNNLKSKNNNEERKIKSNDSMNENIKNDAEKYEERKIKSIDSMNENSNNIKENFNEDYNYSDSKNEINNYNYINNNEGEEFGINQKNNNESNNIINSSNNYSGNLSSTDYNKSDNFINENNINNSPKKNIEKINNIKEFKNKYNIQRNNILYIQNDYNKEKMNNIRDDQLYVQKNTNIEIKKIINLNKIKENIKLKDLLELDQNKKENKYNNIKLTNIKENNNNSESSHSHPININGSLFTCGGNISEKTNNKDSDIEEFNNKNNINNLNNNNFIYKKKIEIKKNRKESSQLLKNKFLNELQNDNSDEENKMDYSNDKSLYFKNKNKIEESQKKFLNSKNPKINEGIKNKMENVEYEENLFDKNSKNNYNKEKNNFLKKINTNSNNLNKYINQETAVLSQKFLKDKYRNNTNIDSENNKKYIKNLNNLINKDYFKDKENSSEKKSSSSKNDINYNDEQIQLNISDSNIENKNNSFNLINNDSINLFLDYIDNILKNENICYNLKESLSLREDITFKELFCLFDYHQNKNITNHEFKKVCKNILNLHPTTDQVRLILFRYDINKDEKLDLKEFLNMISPIKKEYLGILFGDKKIQKPFHSELSDKSKKLIVNLIKTIILNESNYYEIREKMKINNFSVNEVWNILIEFSKNKSNLNLKEFRNFLRNFSYNWTQYEIEIVFNKFDFDKDELINFDDFSHEFSI